MNRFTKIFALGFLMVSSSVALADRGNDRNNGHGNDRGNHSGNSNNHQNQQYGRYDGGGRGNQKHGNNKHGNKHSNNKHGNEHQNRHYANNDRYRHNHNGRYCYVRHAPGYVTGYGPRVIVAAPPVVVLPRLPQIVFGGTIIF